MDRPPLPFEPNRPRPPTSRPRGAGRRALTSIHDSATLVAELARRANRLILRGIDRVTPSEQNRVFALTLVVGAVCGLAAVAFHLTLRFADQQMLSRVLRLSGNWRLAALVATPALGALVAGIALNFAPDARGSGIPQVKWTYSAATGRLRFRDAVAKVLICALQIGSGSSLGREGPTVQVCASVASALGRLFALSPSNQRRLIPVGAAAGIAAAFNAPVAAVTFVIEELVGDLDTTVLSGVVVAAALAAVVERSILGEHPFLEVPGEYGLAHASSLLVFGALGVAAGLAGHAFTHGLLDLRRRFRRRTRVPGWGQPAVGGLLTGAIAAAVLKLFGAVGVAGMGQVTLTRALHGELVLNVLAVLFAAKLVATVYGYASGGAGGIFSPALFVGGMLGGLFAAVDHYGLGHDDAQMGAFALVGMGAFFAAVIRAPITSILIIFEMTGNYRLILPLMLANTVAFVTARRFSRVPIYDALLEQDGLHTPQGKRSAQLLGGLRVADALVSNVVTLVTTETVSDALERVELLSFTAFPVVADDGTFRGILTEARLRRLAADGCGDTFVADHVRVREYLRAQQSLRDALAAMNRLGAGQLAVVDEENHTRLIGILSMSDVVRILLRAEERGDGPPSRKDEPSNAAPMDLDFTTTAHAEKSRS